MDKEKKSKKRKFEEIEDNSSTNELILRKRRRLMTDTNAEEETKERKSHTNTLSEAIATTTMDPEDHTMADEVAQSARYYYLNIVENRKLSHAAIKEQIYQDLVIGTKAQLEHKFNIKNDIERMDIMSLKYHIGLSNDQIQCVQDKVLFVGSFDDNDIHIDNPHVSRIHCVMFKINEKLIVFDGWSANGTATVNVVRDGADDEAKQKHLKSTKKERNILQFNVNDTIHLRFANRCGHKPKGLRCLYGKRTGNAIGMWS
eukprot:548905_1